MIIVVCQEFLDTDLLSGLYRHMPSELVRVTTIVDNLVFAVVFLYERIHITLRDRLDIVYQIVDTVMIDLPAEFDLRFHFIAFGYRHVIHVVAKTAYTDMRTFYHAQCGPHPASELFLHARIRPVSDDDLALDPHTAHDMTVLSVAMRRLVLIHEIHINRIIGKLFVKLRMQMAERLLKFF